MPCCRQSSTTATPLSPCRRMCTICSGVNLLVRIALVLPLVGDRDEALYASGRGSGKRVKTKLGCPRDCYPGLPPRAFASAFTLVGAGGLWVWAPASPRAGGRNT